MRLIQKKSYVNLIFLYDSIIGEIYQNSSSIHFLTKHKNRTLTVHRKHEELFPWILRRHGHVEIDADDHQNWRQKLLEFA